ncbi:hypothetical protein HY995_05280 [Candidatus Micrarchaeota archaeon]|nr:hypothetical protein [Candidatus Micrarchaeota archaeon]MBI5177467.1 hypothetical protein [Candidatus Micrarchaeota archaeon]
MRGQIISIDFLIAVAILALAIGAIAQAAEFAAAHNEQAAGLQLNSAWAIAEMASNGQGAGGLGQRYCIRYSNGTDLCGSAPCGNGDTLAAQRAVACSGTPGGYCLMNVVTCR